MPGLLDSQSLLSPQEEGFARQQGFMNLAAQLMKGAAYSVIPKSPFETLGNGLEGYTQGYNGAADQLMKRELLHSTIDQKRLGALQMIGQYAGLGIPIPPLLRQMAGGAGAIGNFGNVGAGAPPSAAPMPQGGGGMPQPSAAPPPAGLPPGLLGGENGVAPMGATATPSPGAAPSGAGVPDVGGILRNLPQQTRYGLLTKGPSADITKDVITKSLTPTDAQKEATSSGYGNNVPGFKAAAKNLQHTPEEKAAIDAGLITPGGKPDVAGYAAAQKARESVAGAKGEYIGSLIKGIDPARKTIQTLDEMKDALDTAGDKITTGPYGGEMLKLKQFAQNAGIPVEGLPNAEIISKLNTVLASQATKQITSRPAVMEFQAFLKANPGLLNSPEGTRKLIDLLRQGSTQQIKLGHLAMDESNLPKWSQVENDFYKRNPIISPFTNTPLGERPKLPAGAQFSRSRMQYRDPAGKVYDVTGAPVQ